jgi:hypothetical protein
LADGEPNPDVDPEVWERRRKYDGVLHALCIYAARDFGNDILGLGVLVGVIPRPPTPGAEVAAVRPSPAGRSSRSRHDGLRAVFSQ